MQNLAATTLDVEAIRADFPALQQTVYGHPLVYLDNAATTQKPQVVIDRIRDYYVQENSNVHRGVHYLSQQATEAYEGVRRTVQTLLNAVHTHEIIFTRGTTEAINLVAQSYGRTFLELGDEVVVTTMEHHSNIVPWQMVCEEVGAHLRVVPVDEQGQLDYAAYQALLGPRTKLVAVTHVSNTLGTINPVKRMIQDAHSLDIPVLVDGAQGIQHGTVDVQDLDCDFYCFSSHKMYGPTGIGILYGKEAYLNAMPPFQGGGDMIQTVSFEKTTYNELPHKFEAGTPNIADTIAFGTAITYLQNIGLDAIAAHEHDLLTYATEQIRTLPGIRLIGTASQKTSVLSFLFGGVHPYDTGTLLDRLGIAVRTGHHCTQPLMMRYGIPGTVRASFAVYNTHADVDRLLGGLAQVQRILA